MTHSRQTTRKHCGCSIQGHAKQIANQHQHHSIKNLSKNNHQNNTKRYSPASPRVSTHSSLKTLKTQHMTGSLFRPEVLKFLEIDRERVQPAIDNSESRKKRNEMKRKPTKGSGQGKSCVFVVHFRTSFVFVYTPFVQARLRQAAKI